MITQNLKIYKVALDLGVYIEQIVKSMDRYYKYTIGSDLRNFSKDILFLINRANLSKDIKRIEYLTLLRDTSEDLKILIYLTKELKAFKSFKQFENSVKFIFQICKQAQGWLNSCQN